MKTLLLTAALALSACYVDNDLYCWYDHACVRPDKPHCNYVMHECHADPQANPDLGPVADLAQPDLAPYPDLAPPADFSPPPPHYDTDIQDDVDALGCASAACHGSGVYTPVLFDHPAPSAQAARMANWVAFKASGSNILSKPLAGGPAHGGGAPGTKPFAGVADPVYARWQRWLTEGSAY